MEVTLGGERLGSGKKEKIHLKNYERSTHNLGYVWKNTQAPGTLVPFMSEVALPGDVWEINLEADGKTMPTVGPLFASYKMQLDVFQIPMRLYQGDLHMNRIGIGLKMQDIKLPQVEVRKKAYPEQMLNTYKKMINASCILRYLGISGTGGALTTNPSGVQDKWRWFNGIPLLAYWDIYKNYYANKQEEKGYVIHKRLKKLSEEDLAQMTMKLTARINNGSPITEYTLDMTELESPLLTPPFLIMNDSYTKLVLKLPTGISDKDVKPSDYSVRIEGTGVGIVPQGIFVVTELFTDWIFDETINSWIGKGLRYKGTYGDGYFSNYGIKFEQNYSYQGDNEPELQDFDLKNIDEMREAILKHTGSITPFNIWNNPKTAGTHPYSLLSTELIVEGEERPQDTKYYYSREYAQEGLGIKTYQSDLFNNWINTEWLDGENGINDITKVTGDEDGFTINELILNKKIFDMLNRIAVSGGSYDDWLDATYTHDRIKSAENPIYEGGLIKEIGFQEVISNSESEAQPLGTLGGRGIISSKHKGGKMTIRVNEPSYIMGIISLTPRIDYSQGNRWDINLKTINDLHKPALDGIGFQELITEQMAFWDTQDLLPGIPPTFKSAGKQPAWINYMTNYNRNYGNFASGENQDFMVLNRNYESELISIGGTEKITKIKDLTTYIDPSKFNHTFAETRRDAMNFWLQVKVDAKVRRKMSAKVIPNL